MTHFYLKIIIPIAVICLSFMLTARAIGTTQPPNPALRGFVEGCEDKPQPCWYGIVPGVTTVQETEQALKQLGYNFDYAYESLYGFSFNNPETQLFRVDFAASCDGPKFINCDSQPLLWIYLFIRSSAVTVGDIIEELGQPFSIGYNKVLGPALFYAQLDIGLQNWIFPWHKVEGFELYLSLDDISEATAPWNGFSDWHGFTSIWYYCQIEGNLPEFVCG